MKRVAAAPARGRWLFMVGLVCLLFVIVAARVMTLQVLDFGRGKAFLQSQGALRSLRTAEIPAYRGVITDRRGEPLAVSTPVISLWADPPRLLESGRTAELARALDRDPVALEVELQANRDRQFLYLSRHRVPADARRVLGLAIPGVYGEREYQRYYPAGVVASHLVGMTNPEGGGIAGVELAFDDWLRGQPGLKRYLKDLHGEAVRDVGVIEEARPGRSIALSIDLRLQYLQHRELQRAIAATGAASGSIVTVDAYTGEILAIVNHPFYNPNNRDTAKPQQTRNRAFTDVFEPGSTMKPLTLVAALESGRFTVDSLIDTSPGRIRVGRKVLPDPRDYGEITLARVIEKSSQVGVTKVALEIGHEPVLDVFRRFGIGEPPGTGFPGERSGLLPNRSRWRPIETVTLAFGYGLSVTPVQLARAYSIFANGGDLPELSLLRLADAPRRERVLDPALAREVRSVLHGVTGEHGTAQRARVEGYEVGGKTGTVHKVGASGYLDDQYVAWFAGMAPVEDPRFVTVVLLDRPKGDDYGGGAAAAPVFARVAEGVLRLLNVAPAPGAEAPPGDEQLAAGVTGRDGGPV